MKTANEKIAMVVITLLVVTNLVTLAMLLNSVRFKFPGHSHPAAGFKVLVERIANDRATGDFNFTTVPPPAGTNAATSASFALATGKQDVNGAPVEKLREQDLPSGPDAASENFFFQDGSYGGRILVDLNRTVGIQQVNTYSWHKGPRGPQLYKLYARDCATNGSSLEPVGNKDPTTLGWTFLAEVDTRPKAGDPGGQYGVSIESPGGLVGHYRYLLFDCKRTEGEDRWGNTFFSKIDVIGQ
jgi:hypothetical protein